VVIVDAGGGTIDLSTYSRQIQNSKSGDNFEEIAAPQCKYSRRLRDAGLG